MPRKPSPRQAHARLVDALTSADRARGNAAHWFHLIATRRLYRPLGHPSLEQYARERLGFTDNRLAQFKQLSEAMERLPDLARAVATGELGWTKAQLVARVATPTTITRWLDLARRTGRRTLADAVRMERQRAQARRSRRRARQLTLTPDDEPRPPRPGKWPRPVGPGIPGPEPSESGELRARAGALDHPDDRGPELPSAQADLANPAADPPTTVTFQLDGKQRARYESMIEQLRKRGHRQPRAELLLEALASLVAAGTGTGIRSEGLPRRNLPPGDDTAAPTAPSPGPPPRTSSSASDPPVQIVIQRCPDCDAAHAVTAGGLARLSPDQADAANCDAVVTDPDTGRKRQTIASTVRERVLARDRHRCRAPGCRSTRFLELHHVVPASRGGSSRAENLITLCSRCHRHLHEHAAACAGTSVQDIVMEWLQKANGGPLVTPASPPGTRDLPSRAP
ncbi:hypothetical protein GF314_04340 [bacterium]|nr:hypothetical protein [bacterium]